MATIYQMCKLDIGPTLFGVKWKEPHPPFLHLHFAWLHEEVFNENKSHGEYHILFGAKDELRKVLAKLCHVTLLERY
jgi:hypothetical protein